MRVEATPDEHLSLLEAVHDGVPWHELIRAHMIYVPSAGWSEKMRGKFSLLSVFGSERVSRTLGRG